MSLGCPECGSLITDVHTATCTWVARHPESREEERIKRYRDGIRQAADYLSRGRNGDALFILEALLAE